jgi:peroxiredoxin
MKHPLFLLTAIGLLLVPAPAVRASAGEIQATAGVSGREVEVRLQLPGGAPAADVQIRLLYAGKMVVAAGSTDTRGRWAATVGRTGTYDALVEYGPGGSKTLRIPFTVLDTPPKRPVPWVTILAGVACLVGALTLLLLRLTSTPRRGLVALRTALLAAGVGLLGWSALQRWLEPSAPAAPADPDVAGAARAYLRDKEVKPLSEPLERLLSEAAAKRVETQSHPLLGQPAPDFELSDSRQKPCRLRERLARGPVVLVFYYGYYCNHCVAQLFALHDDIARLRELGAEVLAVSADPPELTRLRFRQYGDFAFPVLSDPGNKVAQVFGVFKPAAGKKDEDQQHGTFVIGRDGRIVWAHTGYAPFTGNPTLLYELARLENRLPATRRE